MKIEQMKQEQQNGVLLDQVVTYAKEYLRKIEELRVYPDEKALKQLEVFDENLQTEGTEAKKVLEMLQCYGKDATVNYGGGQYFGFVMGGNLPVSQYARVLADIWDQNAGLYLSSPIAGKLEEVCEKWLVSLLGLPEHTAASFVSGSSMANFYTLLTARNEILRRQGYDVVQHGLYHTKPIRVVLGEQAHSSVIKALVLAGYGKENMEFVPVDDQGRMLADQVPPLDKNTVLILQAGHVNTGAFDPFDEVCDRAREAGAWIHIDGAFGLWAAASENRKNQTKGIEKADSWTMDAHKTLNIPYDSGIAFCRDREGLVRTMQASGSYLQFSEHRDGMLYGVEMSRRARGIELWAALKYLGRDGVAKLIDTLCDQASYLADRLKAIGLQVVNEVVYNQVIVSRETDEETEQLLKAIQDSCEIWCGGATHQGRKVIRFSVCSWQMTRDAIDRSVSCISKLL